MGDIAGDIVGLNDEVPTQILIGKDMRQPGQVVEILQVWVSFSSFMVNQKRRAVARCKNRLAIPNSHIPVGVSSADRKLGRHQFDGVHHLIFPKKNNTAFCFEAVLFEYR